MPGRGPVSLCPRVLTLDPQLQALALGSLTFFYVALEVGWRWAELLLPEALGKRWPCQVQLQCEEKPRSALNRA